MWSIERGWIFAEGAHEKLSASAPLQGTVIAGGPLGLLI